MSKRIKISFNSNRPNLGILFHQYLDRKANENNIIYTEDDYEDMAAYWDKMFPGWDDDFYDEGETVYPMLGDSYAHGKKGKRKNADVSYSFYDDDDSSKSSKHKHKRGGRRSRARLVDIATPYSGYEENPTEIGIDDEYDDHDYQEKAIWFYPDYHYKDDKLEFNSLKAFDKYCAQNGYSVPKYVESDIVYRYESHCCLNPLSEKDGILEIMSEHSYGEMFYEACDASELSAV